MKETPVVVIREALPSDYDWIIQRHGDLYRREYGWDATFQELVATVLTEYADRDDPEAEAGWIAEVEGERVGCIFCMKRTDEVAQLRILLVEPSARGLGIGGRLVDQCINFARRTGYEQMLLWTNNVLTDARRIYERHGFHLVEEETHHSFGHDLVGQNWWMDL